MFGGRGHPIAQRFSRPPTHGLPQRPVGEEPTRDILNKHRPFSISAPGIGVSLERGAPLAVGAWPFAGADGVPTGGDWGFGATRLHLAFHSCSQRAVYRAPLAPVGGNRFNPEHSQGGSTGRRTRQSASSSKGTD